MAQQMTDDEAYTDIRLPRDVIPSHYDLYLSPNFEKFTFNGQVNIHYSGSEAESTKIVLNALYLEISEGSVSHEGEKIPLSSVIYSPKSETATLIFAKPIPPKGVLSLVFNGTLSDRLDGFYRTTFKIDGVDVCAATTHFEPTHARKCYPCWDEPAIRATFSVKLAFEESLNVNGKIYDRVALSNMPEILRYFDQETGLTEVTYEKSPPMSTYLTAFIVGPFEYLERDDGKRPYRVYTAPGKTKHANFALDVASRVIPFYESYFNVPYTLKKLDLIAIPDFAIGAMENWGLVTYRESCLLVDPDNTATARKQRVATIVAHELAHQWFGNLVTLEWWTHLWLKEGFATFMQFLSTDFLFPDYNMWSQFIIEAYTSSMGLDALNSSHQIEIPVGDPADIGQIFDQISYEKGASIIRMLHGYIGDEHFRKGMKQYLTSFAHGHARTEDLWSSLEAASGKPVAKLMSCWTSQKGFPLLTVSLKEEDTVTKLSISQQKFVSNGQLPAEEAESLWTVPVKVMTDSGQTTEVQLLQDRTGEVVLNGVGHKWVKINPGLIDFYRTSYSSDMAAKLLPAIKDKTLAAMDRLGIQSDLFALCQAGQASTADLLKLLSAYKNEDNCIVWHSIDECMIELVQLLVNTDNYDPFCNFGRWLYSDIFEKLGWESRENEKHTVPITRASVISRLISFKHEGVVKEAVRRFESRKEQPIPADLRSPVYRAAASCGNEKMLDELIEIFRSTDQHEERNRIIGSLGYSNKESLKRVIDFIMSSEVRNQDKILAIGSIGRNHPLEGWQIFKDHHKPLIEKFSNVILTSALIRCTTENFATELEANEIERYFVENSIAGGQRAVQQSIETIRLKAAWLDRDSGAIKSFLSQL